MEAQIAFGVLRHALTTIGGAYLAKYGIDGATIDAVVGGLVSAVGVWWSISEKRRSHG